jgi:hypothetical protein
MPEPGGWALGSTRETPMKKQVKKLVLAKETLRRLMAGDLIDVAGGSITINSPTYASCGERFCLDEPIGPSC